MVANELKYALYMFFRKQPLVWRLEAVYDPRSSEKSYAKNRPPTFLWQERPLRHHGRRSGQAVVPVDEGARETGSAIGGQIPVGGHSHFQLH